jgi:L-alanine-DL-glutamate epimerase-like enolase superfamily enzyme
MSPSVDGLDVTVCRVPTDAPESDGTLAWDATTIIIVEATADGVRGLGYTYGDAAIGRYVSGTLRGVVLGRPALDVPAAWLAMQRAARNDGARGPAAMAISAVDIALHDLRARLLGVPLATALGAFHDAVPVYGSGGFTSYDDDGLAEQLGGWAAQGIPRVKMKVGRNPAADAHRVAVARAAVGPDTELYVDANGAYSRAQARAWAARFAAMDVTYLEEPVTSDDLEGLRLVRDTAPPGLAVAAGEYAYDLSYVARMAPVVDVQQADVTRCGGITPFLQIGALCQAVGVRFSAHCAPAAAVHACCAVQPLEHLEWFHDHTRIERMLFDGTLEPTDGLLRPDPSRAGHGLELRQEAVASHAVAPGV